MYCHTLYFSIVRMICSLWRLLFLKRNSENNKTTNENWKKIVLRGMKIEQLQNNRFGKKKSKVTLFKRYCAKRGKPQCLIFINIYLNINVLLRWMQSQYWIVFRKNKCCWLHRRNNFSIDEQVEFVQIELLWIRFIVRFITIYQYCTYCFTGTCNAFYIFLSSSVSPLQLSFAIPFSSFRTIQMGDWRERKKKHAH